MNLRLRRPSQVLRTVEYFLQSIEFSWPMGIFWDLQNWVLEKEISQQSDVPIILVLGGTPTLHIIDEHVISFTPTNTKFQKNALSHIK